MPVISFINPKGGGGKTTSISNLAVALLKLGHKVKALDADPQNSLSQWNKIRDFQIQNGEDLKSLFVASVQGQSLIEIVEETKKVNPETFILIDTTGTNDQNTRAAMLRSEYIITPCSYSPIELWEVHKVIKLTENLAQRTNKEKIKVLLFFNKTPTNPKSHEGRKEAAIEYLESSMIFPDKIFNTAIKERVVFQDAMGEGKGVVEYKPSNPDAKQEILSLAKELVNFIK